MSEPAPAAPPPPKVPPDATPLEAFFKGNRPLAAVSLFLLLEAVPVIGLVIALREDNSAIVSGHCCAKVSTISPLPTKDV